MITVIANLKGGTGKSTVTFNLAVWLSSVGCCRTTVIDLDPQRTLSDAAALRMEEGVEPSICVEVGSFAEVTFPKDAEEIVIDVGTADLGSFKQALMIADRVLIPVTPSQADIWSTQRFIAFLSKNTHGNPPESITFLNRAEATKENRASDEAAAALDALPGTRLIAQRMSDRAAFRDSFSEGLAVFELEPRSVAAREFKALAEALFNRDYPFAFDRLRQQKSSTAVDRTFHRALETPSAKLTVRNSISLGDRIAVPPAAPVHENWEREPQVDKKQNSKKPKKTPKEKRRGKTKKNKKGKR